MPLFWCNVKTPHKVFGSKYLTSTNTFIYLNVIMKLENIFKALGENARLRMVMLLLDKVLCGMHLEKSLKISQTNVSRHMAKLKAAKIVQEKKVGQWRHFSIHKDFKTQFPDLYAFLLNIRERDPVYQKDFKNFKKYEDCGCKELSCSCHE